MASMRASCAGPSSSVYGSSVGHFILHAPPDQKRKFPLTSSQGDPQPKPFDRQRRGQSSRRSPYRDQSFLHLWRLWDFWMQVQVLENCFFGTRSTAADTSGRTVHATTGVPTPPNLPSSSAADSSIGTPPQSDRKVLIGISSPLACRAETSLNRSTMRCCAVDGFLVDPPFDSRLQ
ncbi:hypothetical protein BDZ85DRAFT_102061 [Elsinoe ampelina]|uniref:Uncharacterized protein n=1 Tax=Elsinoe ampelina TaxID=302913 RepID=A0A6A6GFK6_9PEZI|nr:hypothetical protein BDZ85DRAFT_102061 [Elsinoe ampelina]